MRLGQLARKLALRPSQIVDFLAVQQVLPDEGSNARLSDEVTERVVLHFAPERLNEILTTEEKNSEPLSASPPIEEQAIITEEVEAVVIVEDMPSPVVEEPEDKPEVIKAPKVELSGLKVLGKIELPEAKKKIAPEPASDNEIENQEQKFPDTEKKLRSTDRKEKSPHQRENYTPRPARNPIALQREQKAREEEEKRKAKVERDKEKRTEYYLQRVKTGQPTKSMKIVSEPVESFSTKEMKPLPKTWLGKFLRWLNT